MSITASVYHILKPTNQLYETFIFTFAYYCLCSRNCQAVPKSNIPPTEVWYNKPAYALKSHYLSVMAKLGALIYGGANNDSILSQRHHPLDGRALSIVKEGGCLQMDSQNQRGLFKEDYKTADSCNYVQGQLRVLSATGHDQYQRLQIKDEFTDYYASAN